MTALAILLQKIIEKIIFISFKNTSNFRVIAASGTWDFSFLSSPIRKFFQSNKIATNYFESINFPQEIPTLFYINFFDVDWKGKPLLSAILRFDIEGRERVAAEKGSTLGYNPKKIYWSREKENQLFRLFAWKIK